MSDQDSFKANLTSGALEIGESTQKEIKIGITYNGGDTPKIQVTVIVHCGQRPDALLASPTELVTVSSDLGEFTKLPSEETEPSEATVSWGTSSVGIELPGKKEFSITLSGFACSTPPGKAKIELEIGRWDDKAEVFVPCKVSDSKLEIEKREPTKPGLVYFTLTPNFVLQAGATEVSLAVLATGYKSATLRRNNEDILAWRAELGKIGKGAAFADRPSITTVYRLELTDENGSLGYYDRTVQVIASGWNRLALPQGYPAWLFNAPNFSGGGGRRLYGIFVDANGKATLHSSATEVDNWSPEGGEVPQHMKHSPGVVFKNKLWLIGGSSFDENEPPQNKRDPRDQVWCYEENPDKNGVRGWVGKKDLNLSKVGARACHACVVVATPEGQEQLWMLGGVHRGHVYNDIWACDGESWRKLDEPKWDQRYRHAAAAWRTGSADGASAEVWVYGGLGGDHSRRSDLLVRRILKRGGGTWSSGVCPDPLPGEGIAVALTTAPSITIGRSQPIIMLGTFVPPSPRNVSVSRILKWQERNKVWEAEEVGAGWERFEASDFMMQAVPFNGFLFVWTLHPSIDDKPFSPPRLNVLVSP